MKKIKIINLIFIGITSLLLSCDMFNSSGKYDLAQPEKISVIKQEIDKDIKADDPVQEISFFVGNSQGFSNDPNMIIVSLAKPIKVNLVEKVIINLLPDKKVKREEGQYMGEINSLPYSKYDLSKVPNYIAEAAALIPTEYEYGGLGDYYLRAQPEGYISHFFTLQVKPKSGATQIKGRRVETTYFEIKFETDKEGKLNMLSE